MIKIRFFFKSLLNGLLGISLEVLLVYLFILSGFVICLIWWGIFR